VNIDVIETENIINAQALAIWSVDWGTTIVWVFEHNSIVGVSIYRIVD
jgi:hypothetical protein